MKNIKIIIIALTFSFLTTVVYSAEKADCSKIDTKTGSGWLKKALCKKGSDKLDADGNFKKGTFNIFKKLKK
tara:strand:+ start:333 stop:548 length:216 start_codon:yes stop_codon:yes gene_type:complete